jgi:hypothetical protein
MQYPPTTAPGAIAAPLVRAWRLTEDEKVASAVYGLLGFLLDPVFWFGIAILFAFSAWDWILGTRVAVTDDRFDGARAYNGVLSKVTGIFMAIGLRAFAEYLKAEGVPVAIGAAVHVGGVGFTGALIVGEIRSISVNQARLGSNSSLMPIVRMLDRILGIDRKEGE